MQTKVVKRHAPKQQRRNHSWEASHTRLQVGEFPLRWALNQDASTPSFSAPRSPSQLHKKGRLTENKLAHSSVATEHLGADPRPETPWTQL